MPKGGFESVHMASSGSSVFAHDLGEFERTPLMLAIQQDDIYSLRELLKAKANVEERDSAGTTPLALAVQLQHHYCVFLLMCYGAISTFQAADRLGIRPLHLAASSGDLMMVKLLMKYHGNPMVKDHSGQSAIDCAALCGQKHVLDFLRRSDSGLHSGFFSTTLAATDCERLEKEGKTPYVFSCHAIIQGCFEWILHKVMYPDRMTRKFVPVFCHLACACALWEHVFASRSLRWLHMPITTRIFEVSVVVVLSFAQYFIRMDPGVSQKEEDSGIEELMSQLESGAAREALPQTKQLCTSTWILKDLRTKFCTVTGPGSNVKICHSRVNTIKKGTNKRL